MSTQNRNSANSLAAGGAFLLLLALWSLATGDTNGYIELAFGVFLLCVAVRRNLRIRKEERKKRDLLMVNGLDE